MNTKPKLLIIDDDIELCELLSDWLAQEGFEVSACHDVQTAQLYLTKQQPDIVTLDVMLPDGNGLTLLKTLRSNYPSLPVLMLSARGEPLDRILGLELGADDYLAKPCDPRELTARLRAILRRHQSSENDSHKTIMTVGDLTLNLNTGQVKIGDELISLTVTESHILELLLQTPDKPVSKEQLSELALGRKLALYDRSLDMHISNLRKKLGNYPDDSTRIANIRNRGYVYTVLKPIE